MGDELDELFGAFDSGVEQEEEEEKQQVTEDTKAPPKKTDSKKQQDDGDDDDEEKHHPKEPESKKARLGSSEKTKAPPKMTDSKKQQDDGDDDDEEKHHPKEPESKKARLGSSEKTKGEDVTEAETATTTAGAASYAALMSSPTAHELLEREEKQLTEEQRRAEEEARAKIIADREIATGTSHDKSVRSYTSYPKHLPPGHRLLNKNEATSDDKRPPKEPAKTYSFELDPFQKQAIGYIDNDESVLVAAHTSAGKTAVAEYAIAKSLKENQRVVYTSPIKALSNQKFRDLQEIFGHDKIGLMTGDITINPTSQCLVMTTEILRSMLYRGSELVREIQWVIYDEIHYMRDIERGVVWEESIILLPHSVRFVFLSATIPNANQFVDWIAEIHHQTCHVVYTNYRPVPLQHYIFPQGGDGLHLVVDERGKFRESNFQKAMATLAQGSNNSMDSAIHEAVLNSGAGKKRGRNSTTGGNKGGKKSSTFQDLQRIVKLLMGRQLHPVIVFSFSKKDCEKYALQLNQEDFCQDDPNEKDLITQVYINAIDSLSEDDRKLPQVEALLPLLKRGIGIHHGGLLPILKEIVEILFSEGLVKVLFATETFAIGINMPAKTVVFTNTRKWDGKDFRWVTSGEYIQMSGRAGRRGKDDRGIVIQMLDEKMEPNVCKDILYGLPDPLNSSYRISYNMLLNLMRVEDVDPEYLLRLSFYQFQREKDAPNLLEQSKEYQKQAENIDVTFAESKTKEQIPSGDGDTNGKEYTNGNDESKKSSAEVLASQYYQMDQQLLSTRRKISKIIRQPEYIVKFLTSGRLVDITIDGESFGWGVLVSCKRKTGGSGGDAGRLAAFANAGGPEYTLDVLLNCVDRHFDNNTRDGTKSKAEDIENAYKLWRGRSQDCRPLREKNNDDRKLACMRVFTLTLENVERLSAVKLFVPQDVTMPEARKKVAVSLVEVKKRLENRLPLLDPVIDLGIKTKEFSTLLMRAQTLSERMKEHELVTDYEEGDRLALVRAYEKKHELLEKARTLRDEARACQTIAMKDDLKKMKRVLKKLGHVDANGVIQTKGRTACEINTADELVVVELIFTGVFNDLSVEQAVSLLSCMTFDERNKDDDDPTKGMRSYLTNPFFKLQQVARTVARVEIACGIDINEDEFVEKFNPGMMEAVYAWCKGAKFIEVQKLTGSFEGTTIRTLRRLEELVRQISAAAKAIGNQELQAKFEKGDELLKRDIVFCSSLYL